MDRSASYAARYIAKNIVAAGLAKKAEVQLAYAIGVAQPVSVRIDTFGTGTVAESQRKAARQIFDLRPAGIIQMLDLKRPLTVKHRLTVTWDVQILIFHGNVWIR